MNVQSRNIKNPHPPNVDKELWPTCFHDVMLGPLEKKTRRNKQQHPNQSIDKIRAWWEEAEKKESHA